jgi:hypothetical protein
MVIDAGKDMFQCVQEHRNLPVVENMRQSDFDLPAIANCAEQPNAIPPRAPSFIILF